MAREFCVPQQTSKLFLAIIFLLGAIGLIIIGLTILPVIGFILAIPFLILSYFFFTRRLDENCNIRT